MSSMSLGDWKAKEGLTVTELAERIGISVPFASQLLSGARAASIDIQIRVEKATKGAVVMDDLRRAREGIK